MTNNSNLFDVDFFIPQNSKKEESNTYQRYLTSNQNVESNLELKKDSFSIHYKSHIKDCEIIFAVYKDKGYLYTEIKRPNEEISFNLDLNNMVYCHYSGYRSTNNPILFNGEKPVLKFDASCYDGYINYVDAAHNSHNLYAWDIKEMPKYSRIKEKNLVKKYGQAYHKNENLILSHLLFLRGINQVKGMPTILQTFELALKELDTVYHGLWDSVLNLNVVKNLSKRLKLEFNKNDVPSLPKKEFFGIGKKNTNINVNEIKETLKNPELLKNIISEYDNLSYEEQNGLLDDLFYGNLYNLNVNNINQLIAAGIYYNDFELLQCTLKMANIKKNQDLVFFITDYMCEDYLDSKVNNITDINELKYYISRGHNSYPSDLYEEDYTVKELQNIASNDVNNRYNKLFHKASVFASIHNNSEFFDKYKDSPIDKFRINLSGFTDKPVKFINDSNKRVQKIVNLRIGFYERMNQKTQDEKEAIRYITSLLDNKKVACYDGALAYLDENGNYTDEYVCAKFEGENLTSDYIHRFDNDIFRNIKEKGILAEAMCECVKNGEITMTNIPEEYKDIFNNLKVKNKSLEKGNN